MPNEPQAVGRCTNPADIRDLDNDYNCVADKAYCVLDDLNMVDIREGYITHWRYTADDTGVENIRVDFHFNDPQPIGDDDGAYIQDVCLYFPLSYLFLSHFELDAIRVANEEKRKKDMEEARKTKEQQEWEQGRREFLRLKAIYEPEDKEKGDDRSNT